MDINQIHILSNINFMIVIILYLINKGNIKSIDSIYYLHYKRSSDKNIIIPIENKVTNYYVSFNYNFKPIINDPILLEDQLFLLTHITILRNIYRQGKGLHLIIDNQKNINVNKALKLRFLKYYKFINVYNNPLYNNTNCYIINHLCAKLLILVYIFMINRMYQK